MKRRRARHTGKDAKEKGQERKGQERKGHKESGHKGKGHKGNSQVPKGKLDREGAEGTHPNVMADSKRLERPKSIT